MHTYHNIEIGFNIQGFNNKVHKENKQKRTILKELTMANEYLDICSEYDFPREANDSQEFQNTRMELLQDVDNLEEEYELKIQEVTKSLLNELINLLTFSHEFELINPYHDYLPFDTLSLILNKDSSEYEISKFDEIYSYTISKEELSNQINGIEYFSKILEGSSPVLYEFFKDDIGLVLVASSS